MCQLFRVRFRVNGSKANVMPAFHRRKDDKKQARVRVTFPFTANGATILLESEKAEIPLRSFSVGTSSPPHLVTKLHHAVLVGFDLRQM
jgi:hypothetical protein